MAAKQDCLPSNVHPTGVPFSSNVPTCKISYFLLSLTLPARSKWLAGIEPAWPSAVAADLGSNLDAPNGFAYAQDPATHDTPIHFGLSLLVQSDLSALPRVPLSSLLSQRPPAASTSPSFRASRLSPTRWLPFLTCRFPSLLWCRRLRVIPVPPAHAMCSNGA